MLTTEFSLVSGWRAMSGADLVTRWSAVPAVVGVAAADLF
jgi:hypothetical protein